MLITIETLTGYSQGLKWNVLVLKGNMETRDMRMQKVLLEVCPEVHDWMQRSIEVEMGRYTLKLPKEL